MPVAVAASPSDRAFFGHPRGLATLFFTEMWERFSYYGMRAFLMLYMVAPASAGGLGFADGDAASIYGTYTGSVWGAAIAGGIIADRFLGQYNSVLIGGIIIAIGHFALAFKALPFFYAGLALIVVGTGLLKPNASTLVGSLYEPGDARRDAGFSIFYMGINLGALFGPLIAGYLAQRVDWHLGFACAGVGMTLGLVQYVVGRKHLASATGRQKAVAAREAAAPSSRIHGGRMEADGRHRDLLPRRRHLLGRLRAGRIDAEPVRRSLHPDRAVRLLVPLVVVPVGAAGVRDPARAGLRLDLGAARHAGSRRCRRSSRSACCSWRWRF